MPGVLKTRGLFLKFVSLLDSGSLVFGATGNPPVVRCVDCLCRFQSVQMHFFPHVSSPRICLHTCAHVVHLSVVSESESKPSFET